MRYSCTFAAGRRRGDLSLSDSIDTDGEGNSLSLMDVIYIEDDMLESISMEEKTAKSFAEA